MHLTTTLVDLNQYGGGCRCLMRLRENAGKPGISDDLFISQFIPRYPEWQHQPGATDVIILCELSKELKLADKMEIFRDYRRILNEHRAGQSILVLTERAPKQTKEPLAVQHHVMLLVAMNEADFTLWCPSTRVDNLTCSLKPHAPGGTNGWQSV